MKKLLILIILSVLSCSGCLVLSNKCEVVRKHEKKVPVTFESKEAADLFKKEFDRQLKHNKNMNCSEQLVIPFIIAANSTKTTSRNALYNDEIEICDTDKDHVITLKEAQIYSGIYVKQ